MALARPLEYEEEGRRPADGRRKGKTAPQAGAREHKEGNEQAEAAAEEEARGGSGIGLLG